MTTSKVVAWLKRSARLVKALAALVIAVQLLLAVLCN